MRDLDKLAAELRAGKINRFDFLRGAAGLGLSAAAAASVLDPVNAMAVMAASKGNPLVTPAHPPKKAKYLIGFSQSELNNTWRFAETKSMKDEWSAHWSAKYDYAYTVANGDTSKQVSDVGDLIAKGCDLIVLTPREVDPLRPATVRALAAGVPVIEIDRKSAGTPGKDYLCLINNDQVAQGVNVAKYFIQNTTGTINYLELRGSTGAGPAIDRGGGWHKTIDPVKRFNMLDSQDGDFTLATAKKIMTNWITKFGSKIDLVYAHNDGMGDGAYQAVQEAGLTKKIHWGSIDGQNDVFSRIAAGQWDVCVTNWPFYGPITWKWVNAYFTGQKVPAHLVPTDYIVTKANAKSFIGKGF
jgi:ABC-type sugar transport system substrate-binding protein